jgi:biofilm PGA synthesis N-glycosyltransferase PgaC
MSRSTYVLITAARNEEDYIEKTIESVMAQTILPLRWVIVDDGSTDRTGEIARRYSAQTSWMDVIRMPEREDRSFAGKAGAFNVGCQRVRDLEYDIIGNLDADISFEKDYFEFLLGRFEAMPELGAAGTHYVEGDFHSYRDSYINVHHVNGQCQMFRRACFEQIGGYQPIKAGGIDWIASTTARMRGWKTFSFSERTFTHHRVMGTAESGILGVRFHYGKKDYYCGGHPLWQIARSVFQMAKPPYLIGGLCLLGGYGWAWLTGMERPVSRELMAFHRREQMSRLGELLRDRLKMGRLACERSESRK